MKIIGIHDGHNASACLLIDGKIEYAIQEERLTRIKNHSRFPLSAIQQLLQYNQLSPESIDRFVFSSRHMPENRSREEMKESYRQSNSMKVSIRRQIKKTPVMPLYRHYRKKQRLRQAIDLGFQREKIDFYDHHLSHAAAAYYNSPWWRNEPVLVLTNDAGGDGLCATVSVGKEGQLKRLSAVPETESIGFVYSMITYLQGMVPEEHEYKVMGMAPYSSHEKHASVRKHFESLLAFSKETNGLTWKRAKGCPPTQYSIRFMRKLTAGIRFDWVCGGLQEFLENFLVEWIKNCIQTTGIHKIALGGGVFMNVKANKKIMELPEVESIYVMPSCGDETNCFGSAFLSYLDHTHREGLDTLSSMDTLYLGPEFEEKEMRKCLEKSNYQWQYVSDIENKVAQLLHEGKVVARFDGRMEFGARALGNRSILADPSRRDVVRIINDMIKNRDFWMPFAPSIIQEYADQYIVNPKQIDASYMIMSFDLNGSTEQLIAASHPYDWTVRPQVVDPSVNPLYYQLIQSFAKRSGRGAVLNTSFNLHGYPIVCSPGDALRVFTHSRLEYMSLGHYLVKKK